MSFLGITASPDFGGTGGKYSDHCVILEEISRSAEFIILSLSLTSFTLIHILTKCF